MADILKNITDRLPGLVKEASFEGANIVLYTENQNFFLDDQGKVKEIVNDIKKRVELRADDRILASEEQVKKVIKEVIPEEAEVTDILFSKHRSIVVIEAKKPGMVIGKGCSILEENQSENSLGLPSSTFSCIKSKKQKVIERFVC
jgi:predicted metal-dependent RNase